MADFDQHPDAILWRAGSPEQVTPSETGIRLVIPFRPFGLSQGLVMIPGLDQRNISLTLELWGDETIRLTTRPQLTESPMIVRGNGPINGILSVIEEPLRWVITDDRKHVYATFLKYQEPIKGWSEQIPESNDSLSGTLELGCSIPFSSYDQFFPGKVESLPIAFLTWNDPDENENCTSLFSLTADINEHFVGTGERFSRMDLAGKSIVLENTDGLGVNSRRAYKNVPLYISSRGYGLFIHTTHHVRLSFADVSSRAVQGSSEEAELDLFLFGGKNPEKILFHYRELTGFPPTLPTWSYGMWMSRMTYFSAQEIKEITTRLRREKYPCDMIHIDTGWFAKDWVCEWKFSEKNFPDPEGFLKDLKDDGFRVSLWQTPNIGQGNELLEEALERRYLAPQKEVTSSSFGSDFSGQDFGGQIDFTNPEAETWYRNKIGRLLDMGAAVIKTDFGEKIQKNADYLNMSAEELHNIYGLLYQRAAFAETQKRTGEGIIWARAGWAGSQRYPLHWGGDAAATWDGMASTIRGGLHLGLSGFGFWSHDVPGFHGIPEFMNTLPTDNLYMRWTQLGVFSSHLRYHGTSPREPWYYPHIAPLIRKWLNLRYKLIPYFLEQAKITASTGYPIFRAMVFRDHEDPTCWHIDDQYYCGEDLLIAPIMNDEGVRDVYLPEGNWVDLWTGERHDGSRWLKGLKHPLETLPVFVKAGTVIPFYPEIVQHTGEMDQSKVEYLNIDESFKGIEL